MVREGCFFMTQYTKLLSQELHMHLCNILKTQKAIKKLSHYVFTFESKVLFSGETRKTHRHPQSPVLSVKGQTYLAHVFQIIRLRSETTRKMGLKVRRKEERKLASESTSNTTDGKSFHICYWSPCVFSRRCVQTMPLLILALVSRHGDKIADIRKNKNFQFESPPHHHPIFLITLTKGVR